MTTTETETTVSSLLSTAPPSSPPTFSFSPFLRSQGHALVSTVPACSAYLAGHCPLGRRCPDRHPTPPNPPQPHGWNKPRNDTYVCKHWLKALCKKGDDCDYLHEYNLRKMSECQFYTQNGYCQNGDECLYLHVKEEARMPQCENYNKGFCELGPKCAKRHVRRKICPFYLAGFCPEGPDCKRGVHPRWAQTGKSEVKLEKTEEEREKEKERRAEEMERVSDVAKGFKREWRGRSGGRRGKWRDRR